jgi:hypothetical protein
MIVALKTHRDKWRTAILPSKLSCGVCVCVYIYILPHPVHAWADPWGSGRLRLWIFSTFGTMKVVRSSPLRTGRLYPQEFSWYSFICTHTRTRTCTRTHMYWQDRRLALRFFWILPFSVLLRSVGWLSTAVSGQPIGYIVPKCRWLTNLLLLITQTTK